MASKQNKKPATRAKQHASAQAKQAQNRRELGGVLCIIMAIFCLICCFDTDAFLSAPTAKLIGGLLGMVLFRLYLFIEPTGKYTLWLVPLTFIGTVILIVLCQMFWVGGVQPGGVVLCILLFNTPVATYISYALNRILDTTIGVLVAWAISYLFPRGWMELWKERIKAHRAAK